MIGFLYLPCHIRTRIYELAIFDHDRGAVFLPRALPRKDQPDVDDLDIDNVDVEPEGVDGSDLERVECVSLRCVTLKAAASGYWIGEENLPAASLASLRLSLADVKPKTDKQILNVLDLAEYCADVEDDGASLAVTPDSIADSDHSTENIDVSRLSETEPGWARRSCLCHYPSLPSDYDSDRVEESQDEDGSKSPSVQGSTVSMGSRSSDLSNSECESGDAECRVCCELRAANSPRRRQVGFELL